MAPALSVKRKRLAILEAAPVSSPHPYLTLLLPGLLLLWPARADVPPLKPRGYTNDFASVLSVSAIARADALADEVERKTGAQIAVVLVQSLDGEPIESYANTLARRWGIGRKDNRGVLLLLVVRDHRSRMEIGYGLEPVLTDGRVGSILRSLRPQLRQGDYDGAVLLAVGQLATLIAEASGVTLEDRSLPRPPPEDRRRRETVDLPIWAILLGALVLIWLISKIGIWPFLLMGGFPGSGGSRRGGGGGWDGGGFSGFGGGDFGGGGASSDW